MIAMKQERGAWTSASNAEADLRCPGRHVAQRAVPEIKMPDRDRDSGQRIHAVLALQGNDAHKEAYAALTQEEKDTHDRCSDIEQRKVVEFFGKDAANPAMKVIREQRFWVKIRVPDVTNPKAGTMIEHSGQPDVVYRLGLRGLVIDYKTLFGEHAGSSSNLQLRDLACLVRGNLLLNEVGTVLAQPWAGMNPDICLYQRADLDRAASEMFERVRASNDPASVRAPGEVQCAFCRAKKDCAQYQKWAGGMVPAMLNVLEVPMEQWTPDQRAMAADRLKAAEDFLANLKAFLKDSLEKDPASVPGWTLAPGQMRATITDPQGVFDRFCKLADKLTLDQKVAGFMSAVAVAKGKLKSAVGTATGLKGKSLQQAVDGLCEGLVEEKQTAPTLARMEATATQQVLTP